MDVTSDKTGIASGPTDGMGNQAEPAPSTGRSLLRPDEPRWPESNGRSVIFLLDACSRFEERLLVDWIERAQRNGSSTYQAYPIPPSRRRRHARIDSRLEACLATDEDPLLAPLRVVWHPEQVNGERAVRLTHLLTFGDPRDPGLVRQVWVRRRHPDRCHIVAGEPARLSELRRRWQQAGGMDFSQTTGLAEFVVRQAALALERAERRLRGARYKVPRFVHEDILARPALRGGVARFARALGRSEQSVFREASRYLREIAAQHSPYVIDLVAHAIRILYRRGYGALHYDRAQLERIYSLTQRHPVVFLPSHKSNLDHLVLQYALHENGHPPNHTAGGINMNFFPMGPLFRRSGVFFIRRTFKDNQVYKLVLRQYVDYLIEKRFSLEWYIEGGRSRSGKLLPPRLGLLAYVVDAYRRGKSDDVFLIPVAIVYDQIQDVGDYVAEQRGAAKERESFAWFLRFVRRLRRRYGDIHLRFGEPLSLQAALGPQDPHAEPNPDEQNLALQKLAFEVAVRINRVTPITPTSLVTLALLGHSDRSLSVDETVAALRNLVDYVRRRNLPTTDDLQFYTPDGVRRVLETLVESAVLTSFAEGPEAVYAIGPEQHLTAAYYRNTVIHFFVNGAIAELALLGAAEDGVAEAKAKFWEETMRLRDLLKFEFFFADKDAYREELRQEIALHDPDWEAQLEGGPAAIRALVQRFRPFSSHRILRPFLEAYRVVADVLAVQEPAATMDERELLSQCMALGKQYRLQRRIRNAESLSKVLFENALRLARNRKLVEPAGTDVTARRQAFARDIRETIRRVDTVDALVASRLAGLIE
jgi:glycerol-3-phosphate O-acyltransferase